jgi:predicted RNA binding protein YcfA (HicA-like mRNA interferase family)
LHDNYHFFDMNKLPRNLSSHELIKKLVKFGYITTRQVGSHVRLTSEKLGPHHITIPAHNPLKVGTLSNILKEVADHMKITKEELIDQLF